MDKWFKDILPDKDPYHNCGRDQMRKKGGPDFKCLCVLPDIRCDIYFEIVGPTAFLSVRTDGPTVFGKSASKVV